MKVGYVLKRYPRYSETFVVNEIVALESLGSELEIFSLRHPDDRHFQDSISRVRAPVNYVTAVGKRASELWNSMQQSAALLPGLWNQLGDAVGVDHRFVLQALEIAKACRERGIKHLHAHFATEASVVASLAARWAGIPHSFTAHAKDIFHEAVDPGVLAKKLLRAERVVTVSDFNRDFLRALCPQASDRITRIYNGLDLGLFPFDANQDRPQRVVGVGRLVPKKGFDVLIDACAGLAKRGVGFECRIVGTGELENELAGRIESYGLSERVRLLGPLPQSQVREEIKAAALLAAPCVQAADGNRDGLPTVLLEAMALGTACVATPVTGIPEAIRDESTGLLVGERGTEALGGAIERLLTDPELRGHLAKNARALVEREFDIQSNARTLQILQSSAGTEGSRSPLGIAS